MKTMRNTRAAHLIALTLLVGACTPPGGTEKTAGGADDHLTCAALISAADKLMASGVVPLDQKLRARGLVASMTHLNAYAIPKGLDERAAFDTVLAERDRLIAATPGAEIVTRASACAA